MSIHLLAHKRKSSNARSVKPTTRKRLQDLRRHMLGTRTSRHNL